MPRGRFSAYRDEEERRRLALIGRRERSPFEERMELQALENVPEMRRVETLAGLRGRQLDIEQARLGGELEEAAYGRGSLAQQRALELIQARTAPDIARLQWEQSPGFHARRMDVALAPGFHQMEIHRMGIEEREAERKAAAEQRDILAGRRAFGGARAGDIRGTLAQPRTITTSRARFPGQRRRSAFFQGIPKPGRRRSQFITAGTPTAAGLGLERRRMATIRGVAPADNYLTPGVARRTARGIRGLGRLGGFYPEDAYRQQLDPFDTIRWR